MEFPIPVISIVVEPKTQADSKKLIESLQKLQDEDPTFKVRTDEETGQLLIEGMGELHLEIIVDRLLREFNVEANVGTPHVTYKETIVTSVRMKVEYKRELEGKSQFAYIDMEFTPGERGTGIVFECDLSADRLSREYVKAVEEGVREAAANGPLAGYETVDFKAMLINAKYDDMSSSDAAFRMAAAQAFRDLSQKAESVLLEPVMAVEITTPDEYTGDIISDLNTRRAKIEGMNRLKDFQILDAHVPLSEMFGYTTDLRSQSQGRASFSMQFERFEQVPEKLQKELLDKMMGVYHF
jgi:elongation factor G